MELVKLKELCTLQSGGTPSRKNQSFYNGTIPWSKISDLEKSKDGFIYETDEHITEEGLKSINNRFFRKGTLLLAMYGSVGKTAISKIDLTTNQAILGINILNKNKLDIFYLRYWFTTIKNKLLNRAVGGTLQNISLGIVKDLEIPLPPLPIQQKIAHILDQADQLVQLNRQLIEKYEQLAQSLFLEMFGDKDQFPTKNASEILELLNYKRIPIKLSDRDKIEGTYPYYGASGIIDYVDNYIFDETCLLIGEDGANLLSRSTPIAFIASNKYWVNNHAHVVSSKSKSDLSYLMYFFNNLNLEPYITGSAQPKLNSSNLKKIPIPIPSKVLQDQFAERIQNIEKQKAFAEESLKKSEELFQSLLHKAFKGELVKEEEFEAA